MAMKGIYQHGDKWRVRKYDKHIGIYDTYFSAVNAVIKAEEEYEVKKYFKQYVTARNWLQLHGHLSNSNE